MPEQTSLVILNSNHQLAKTKFAITPTGLKIIGSPTYDEWYEFGERLKKYDGAIQWAIGDWLNEGEKRYGDTYAQAIDETQADTWKHYKWVSEAVEKCTRVHFLSWTHHREIAKFEPAEQKRWLKLAKKNDWSVAELHAAIHLETRADRIGEIIDVALNDSLGKFPVLYVDPPWRYEFVEADNRAIENQYPTMSLEELCALPVQTVAADECILFLWTTSPKLAEAMQVLDAWEFTYRTCAVWVKDKIGMGYYFRQRHELLFVATKGHIPVPKAEDRFDSVIETSEVPILVAPTPFEADDQFNSVIEAPRLAHSQKPEQVYIMIEQMYPEFLEHELLCELFARNKRKGWKSWGNEV